MSCKHRVGAATLLIHMLANPAMNMLAKSMFLGFVPARLITFVASILSIECLLSAAAMVKPPSSNIMVGFNICARMNLVASGAVKRLSLPSVDRSTPRVTTRKGTSIEVTKKGMTCKEILGQYTRARGPSP